MFGPISECLPEMESPPLLSKLLATAHAGGQQMVTPALGTQMESLAPGFGLVQQWLWPAFGE